VAGAVAYPLLSAGMAAPGGTRPALYFVNAPVDVALIGGCSIAAWAAIAWLPGANADLPVLVAVLARLCNWPHFAATSYRLYRTRDHVAQYPMTALVVPLVVAAATAWALVEPVHVAPFFVKLVLLWSPYHFSGQTLGVSLVYARRAGVPVTRVTRTALAGVVFGAFAWATARAESGSGVRHYLGIDHPKLGVPPWLVHGFAVAVVACGVVLLVQLARWSVRERRIMPPIVLLPAAAQLVWFVAGRDYERFQVLVPFFHSLQYLLVAWTVHLADRLPERSAPPSVLGAAAESARWWATNVVGGLCLFAVAPWLCTLLGYDLLFAMAVVTAGVQLHHFLVDGVIWKLANPRVRSPLLANVPRLLALREAA
jgi:hypothetical protein